MHDARHRALQPARWMAEATRLAFINPFLPISHTPMGRVIAAGSKVLEDLLSEYPKPEWQIDETVIDGETIAVTPKPVLSLPFCDLLHFERATKTKRDDPPVFLAAPMSGHYATLLRGTVKALLPNHDVYITDWRDARMVPTTEGRFGLDEYIDTVMHCLEDIWKRHGKRRAHAMAVCQPAPLVLATAALMAEDALPHRPASMTLMGGPIDTGASPTVVTQMAENRPLTWFKSHLVHRVPPRFPGGNRQVYPGFMQLRAFWSMQPARHAGAHWKMFEHLVEGDGESAEKTRAFYDEYMAVMDVTADFYLETVDHIFKRRSIPNGTFSWNGRQVNMAAIDDIALLTIEGGLDDISAPGQTKAAHGLCPNIPDDSRDHLLQDGVGHYGIFNGRVWRETICPHIAGFIRRSEAD